MATFRKIREQMVAAVAGAVARGPRCARTLPPWGDPAHLEQALALADRALEAHAQAPSGAGAGRLRAALAQVLWLCYFRSGDAEPLERMIGLLREAAAEPGASELLATPEQAAGRAEVDGCGLSAEAARRLTCDAVEVAVLDGGPAGEALSVGRRSRRVSAALQRALETRDSGCCFPGCTHQRHLHNHHVTHRADGGSTELSNLVRLCSTHHRAVHEGGFTVRATADGRFVFRDPEGRALPHSPTPPQGKPRALAERLAADGTDLDPLHGASTWDGAPVDYPWAIQAIWELVHREGLGHRFAKRLRSAGTGERAEGVGAESRRGILPRPICAQMNAKRRDAASTWAPMRDSLDGSSPEVLGHRIRETMTQVHREQPARTARA